MSTDKLWNILPKLECPACGSTNYQQPIEEFPSSVRISCGVCKVTYGVRKIAAQPLDKSA